MNSIPWLEDLEYLSTFERVFLVLIVIIGCMTTGFVIDAIMKNLGLGPIYNGVLALIGICIGIYVRYRFFAYRADDPILEIGFAIGVPVVLFLVLALAKTRGL
jgi:hypothetical protein